MAEPLRLNRFLAQAGVGSRRRCDELIRSGRILVNGAAPVGMGARVDPATDDVRLDGALLRVATALRTIALHKPIDVLVTARDSRGRRTVLDLVTDAPGRLFPVGRLDYRSEGLLLLTNDGDLAFRLAHPRFKVDKLYRVEATGPLTDDVVAHLAAGVTLDDGPTQPAGVRVVARRAGGSTLEIELREGRKRQIRRMLALFGLEVTRLVRVRFGPIVLGTLPAGSWRTLEPVELRALHAAAGLDGDGSGDGDRAPGGAAP